MGYCSLESRYKELYRDTEVLGAAARATTRPATPTIQPWQGYDTAGSARAGGLAGGECHDTKLCIVTEAWAWPLGVVSRYSICIVTGARSG